MLIDWKNPDYVDVFTERLAALERLRAEPDVIPEVKAYYAEHPWDFITDWGVTYDPRNVERGLPAFVPFILFDKQVEWIKWAYAHWRSGTGGLCEKSRDCGVTWLAVSLACTLCLFHRGVAIGFGSRKSEYVDKIGTYKPILPKGRLFMDSLPEEFRGSYTPWRDAPYMRIAFPDTGSLITGEAGDDIGRGDRTSAFFVDEAAHLERPDLVDMALSQTTNVRIDMSSVRGMANSFAQRRHGGKIDVFVFDWKDDPRKDQAWYDKQCAELDPVVVAQEIDRDYLASVTGVVIPGPWARACIGARKKLGIAPQGQKRMAADIADEGKDKNAAVIAQGFEIIRLEQWSGKGSDIFATTERCFELCDEEKIRRYRYDEDGLGAGSRGDARVLNERRALQRLHPITATGWRGSAKVVDPDGIVEGTIGSDGDKGRSNKDYFANRKAQGWWELRRRARNTFRWVEEGIQCNPDDLLSIDKEKCPMWAQWQTEISQPTYSVNPVGKIVINKTPEGQKSPNLGDGTMELFAKGDREPINVTRSQIAEVIAAGRRRR